jgi:hypothetical protein
MLTTEVDEQRWLLFINTLQMNEIFYSVNDEPANEVQVIDSIKKYLLNKKPGD